MFPLSDTLDSYAGLVAPDMLTPDGQVDMNCPKIQAWLECQQVHNDMSNWTPEHAIYIAHCPTDEMLPYQYAYNQYLAISNNGQNPNVHMLNIPANRFASMGGMKPHFIIAFMAQVMMAFAENPESMQRLYKAVK
jgi:hypothetical protein